MLERGSQRGSLPLASRSELKLPLLAGKLSYLPYMYTSADSLQREIQELVPGAALLHYQPQTHLDKHACWFLFRGRLPGHEERDVGVGEEALVLVFRGSQSATDFQADLLVQPTAGPHGGTFHGGFLSTLTRDATLHQRLAEHAKGSVQLFMLGHSLGGALALTLLHANLLPSSHCGHVTCIALGSPKVSVGVPPPSTRPHRIVLCINEHDPVPRLLGSPLPILQSAAIALSSRSTWVDPQLLASLSGFMHAPQSELYWLSGGTAKRVPPEPAARDAVEHLADGITPNLLQDHRGYVDALERALL